MMIVRFAIRTVKRRFFILEEIFAILAWAFMVAICATIISITRTSFKAAAVTAGYEAPYSGWPQDTYKVSVAIFVTGILFWSCLWCVKMALLLQCKRLIERQPIYTVIWWCIVVFVGLSYIACYIPSFFVCSDIRNLFNNGERSLSIFLHPLFQLPADYQNSQMCRPWFRAPGSPNH